MPADRDATSLPRQPLPQDLYCAAPSLTVGVGNGLHLLHDLASHRVALATRRAAEIFQAHAMFRALDPRQAASVDEVRGDAAIAGASGLIEEGWLISHRDLLARLMAGQPSGGDKAERISSVVVVTRDRPRCAARLLDGLLANRRAFGRSYRVLVVDDTRDGTDAETRAHAERLAARHDAPVSVFGLPEKLAFIDRLARHCDASRALLAFALLGPSGAGPTFGANANCALLQTAGELVASFDDDVVCQVGEMPGARSDVILSADPDPTEFYFCESRAAAAAAPAWIDRDVIALHEQVLGRHVGAVLAEHAADRVRCDALTLRLWNNARAGRGEALVTAMGVAGDSGMWSPHALLMKGGASRQRLIASAAAYENACVSREVIRGAPALTLTGGGALLHAAVGLDNRSPLVPYMPAFRNMEGVFAICLAMVAEHGYVAYLPSVVLHDPPETRTYHKDAVWRDAAALRVGDIVSACVMAAPLPAAAGGRDDRAMAIGQYLATVGVMSAPLFEEFVRFHVLKMQHARLRRLGRLVDGDAPGDAPWRADLVRQIDAVRRSIAGGALAMPVDLTQAADRADAVDTGGALRTLQSFLRHFGELLQVWPGVVGAAGELTREGALSGSRFGSQQERR